MSLFIRRKMLTFAGSNGHCLLLLSVVLREQVILLLLLFGGFDFDLISVRSEDTHNDVLGRYKNYCGGAPHDINPHTSMLDAVFHRSRFLAVSDYCTHVLAGFFSYLSFFDQDYADPERNQQDSHR